MILLQNYVGSKQNSYKIAKMHIFATEDKAKPYTGSTRGLNLATARLTIIQVTKLTL
jgi:hypothetical protein